MAQQIDQIEVAEAIEQALELIEDEISLLDLTRSAVPDLSEESIRKFVHFLVDGKRVTDADTLVTRDMEVRVVPCFAGGN